MSFFFIPGSFCRISISSSVAFFNPLKIAVDGVRRACSRPLSSEYNFFTLSDYFANSSKSGLVLLVITTGAVGVTLPPEERKPGRGGATGMLDPVPPQGVKRGGSGGAGGIMPPGVGVGGVGVVGAGAGPPPPGPRWASAFRQTLVFEKRFLYKTELVPPTLSVDFIKLLASTVLANVPDADR